MHRASVLQRKRENGEPGRNINASDASGDKMACDINPLSEVHIGRLTSLYIRYACEIEEHRLMLARILAELHAGYQCQPRGHSQLHHSVSGKGKAPYHATKILQRRMTLFNGIAADRPTGRPTAPPLAL